MRGLGIVTLLWRMVELLIILIFASMTIVPMVLTVWLLISATRAATSFVGTCRKCGYDLRMLGEIRRCPECGQPFRVGSGGEVIS